MKLIPRLHDLPVIVTSSVEGIDTISHCIGRGAEDDLPNPVTPVLLKARLSSNPKKKRLRDEQRILLRSFATTKVVQDLAEQGFAPRGRRVPAFNWTRPVCVLMRRGDVGCRPRRCEVKIGPLPDHRRTALVTLPRVPIRLIGARARAGAAAVVLPQRQMPTRMRAVIRSCGPGCRAYWIAPRRKRWFTKATIAPLCNSRA